MVKWLLGIEIWSDLKIKKSGNITELIYFELADQEG